MLPALWSQGLQQRKWPGQHVPFLLPGPAPRGQEETLTGTITRDGLRPPNLHSASRAVFLTVQLLISWRTSVKCLFPPKMFCLNTIYFSVPIRSGLGIMYPTQKSLVQLRTAPAPEACLWFPDEWKQNFVSGFTQEIVLNFVLKSLSDFHSSFYFSSK